MFIGEIISGLVVEEGLTVKQGSHLVELTKRYPEFLKFTSDYSIQDVTEYIFGIAWFREEIFQDYDTTFAIRVYPHIPRKGLAVPFMNLAFRHYLQSHPYAKVWLEVHLENQKAIKVYDEFGFSVISYSGDKIQMGFARRMI